MDMTWAWLGAAAVGLSLGIFGSGGAILTVPILVYGLGHAEKNAVAESLAIVGMISLVSALRLSLTGRVDWRTAGLLAVPGMAGAWGGALTASYISGAAQLIMLSMLMLLAAVLMVRGLRQPANPEAALRAVLVPPLGQASPARPWMMSRPRVRAGAVVLAQGVWLGFVTGLVGVGGGFLIVPVLVLLRRMPMVMAVGTSMAIIAFNSGAGLAKNLSIGERTGLEIDWGVVGVFVALGAIGAITGTWVAGRLPQVAMRWVFACFLVLAAGFIVVHQTFWPSVQ
jgi:uncharacterized membrane protein YfcA